MMDRLAETYGVDIVEKPIGFKHIAPLLMNNALIGGEESGGYGFRNHLAERDGILAALYFLDLMVKTGKTPSQLLEHLFSITGTHHYNRIDVHFPPDERENIIKKPYRIHLIGNYDSDLKRLIEKFGLQKRVTLHGELPRERFLSILASTDIFVIPSLYEQWGSVLQEALSYGIPAIASRNIPAFDYFYTRRSTSRR